MSKKQKPNLNIEDIKIQTVRLTNFHVKQDIQHFRSTEDVSSLKLNVKTQNEIKLKEKTVTFHLHTSLRPELKESVQSDAHACLEASYTFYLENLEDFVTYDENKQSKLPLLIGEIFVGIAFSTHRGILYNSLQGSLFDGYLLPVVIPVKLLMNQY